MMIREHHTDGTSEPHRLLILDVAGSRVATVHAYAVTS